MTVATSDAVDYGAFLRHQLATQPHNVMSHVLGNEKIWVKRAGTPHSMGRYRAMGVLAWLLRLPVLRPVPNPGGTVAISTEVRRLHDLAARGIRVPQVLAVQPDGFAMRHLGRIGVETHSLSATRSTTPYRPATAAPCWPCGSKGWTRSPRCTARAPA
jgi:hypothetical protein|uniref:hypothetical protein n=1 Tax=uncultured Acidovorax sp. TaxID=158751 RepID=UPI000A441338